MKWETAPIFPSSLTATLVRAIISCRKFSFSAPGTQSRFHADSNGLMSGLVGGFGNLVSFSSRSFPVPSEAQHVPGRGDAGRNIICPYFPISASAPWEGTLDIGGCLCGEHRTLFLSFVFVTEV